MQQSSVQRAIYSIEWTYQKGKRSKNNHLSLYLRKPEKANSIWSKHQPLTVWITRNCGKFWRRWEYQTTWPASRNLYAGQEATVRTGHGTTYWFQIGEVCQGCILSPCLFNFYVGYIMRNAGLEEAQAGIKIAGRNINNLRYAYDTTLMAESEEELKSLLMKVK